MLNVSTSETGGDRDFRMFPFSDVTETEYE